MIEIYVKCDVCGNKKRITYTKRETIAVKGSYCPKGWVARWTGQDYQHICPECLKELKERRKKWTQT